MKLTFSENYSSELDKKKELIRFIKKTHNLDLTRWDELGFWDLNYRPFSFFEGDKIVSNVCIYSMDMKINGNLTKVAQISAVGTLPDYGKQGLNSELTKKAMNWAKEEHDFFFLFADKDAEGYYKKTGFKKINEYKPQIKVPGKKAIQGSIKLSIQKEDDLKKICAIASKREPVSDKLGVVNEKLFMFWAIYYLNECIHYIHELDILVLFERKDNILTIYDIVGSKTPPFLDIYPYISDESDRVVEFLFMPDKLNLDSYKTVKVEDNGTHIYGEYPFEGCQIIFPFTAHA